MGRAVIAATALDPAVLGALRGGLALVLLTAAFHKARDLGSFRSALAGYGLLPRGAPHGVALAFGVAEVCLGLALLVPMTARAGAWGALALLGLYTGAIASALLRGRRAIDCGCGGPAAHRPVGEGLLVRNAALIGVALVAAAPAASRTLVFIDASTIAGGALALALVYAAADVAIANAPHSRALRGTS